MRLFPRAVLLLLALLVSHPALAEAEAPGADDLVAFESHVDAIEREGGALDPRLVEPLAGLGTARLEAGRPAQAASALERALHIARVNEGLHNPAHLPLMQQLLRAHVALGDAAAVDRDYQQIYWVRARNAGSAREALLPVIDEIASGRLQAYDAAPAATGVEHLIKADALYDLARRILDQSGNRARAEPGMLYHAALVNQRLALEMQNSRLGFHDLREAMITNGRGVFEVNEAQARDTIFQEAFLKGEWIAREAVKQAQERETAEPFALAEAYCFMGDYYQSFRRHFDASREYRRALETLEDNGLLAQAEKLFGAPVLVTRLLPPGAVSGTQDAGGRPWVDVRMDVGADGWPRNVLVEDQWPKDDPGLAARGARAVKAWHFRPRFADGAPMVATGVRARYIFRD